MSREAAPGSRGPKYLWHSLVLARSFHMFLAPVPNHGVSFGPLAMLAGGIIRWRQTGDSAQPASSKI
jgi:hypothetical protein